MVHLVHIYLPVLVFYHKMVAREKTIRELKDSLEDNLTGYKTIVMEGKFSFRLTFSNI